MKRIIIASLLTIIGLGAYGQSWTPAQYTQAKGLIGDSVMRAPRVDTVWKGGTKDSIGAIVYSPSGKALWLKTDTGWAKVGAGANDLSPYMKYADTSAMLSPYLRIVDTAGLLRAIPNLQQVTDAGQETTNAISITGNDNAPSPAKGLQLSYNSGARIEAADPSTGDPASLTLAASTVYADDAIIGPLTTTGNAKFTGNGTPGSGKIPVGTDGAGNWLWNGSYWDSTKTLLRTDTLYMKRYTSRIFPYDSVFYAPATNIYTGITAPFEIFNLGNFAENTIPFQQTPIGIGRGNWSGLLTNNMVLDTALGPGWKLWNTNYPASAVEVGWEGVTFHYVPHGYSNFTEYPHEGLQLRGGIDGVTAYDADSQYVQLKTTMVGRYDTAFDAGNTAYGWGYSRKPFAWFFSEYPTKQLGGNIYSSYDQYYSGVTSGPISAFMRSRGSYTSKAAIQAGDTLGNIGWYSYDGDKFLQTGRMYANAIANASSDDAATAITVQASNGGSSSGNITITSNGNIGINTTAPQSMLHLVRQDYGGIIYLDRYNNTGDILGPGLFGVASRGTISSPTGVLANDPLMNIGGTGHNGTILDRTQRGAITISAYDNWTSSYEPTRLDISLTHSYDDMGRVLSVDNNGNTGIGGAEDNNYKLFVHGTMKASANIYSTGGYDLLTRNQSTGAFETISSTTFAPASGSANYAPASGSSSYIWQQTASIQPGGFRVGGQSYIIGSSTIAFNVGQTGGTSTNTANLNIDGVNGDFSGLDYINLNQQQNGNGFLRNFNSSGTLTLGAGSISATNIVLSNSNVTTFGGAVQYPIASTSASLTLTAAHYTIRATSSGITLTFPSASSCAGRIYCIINYNTGGTITTSAFLSPSAVSTTTVANQSTIWVQSDGTNWYQIK